MKIAMLSSEMYPYAKSGGLADAVRSLADALSKKGHDVRLIIPEYYDAPMKTLYSEGIIPLGLEHVHYRIHRLSLGTGFAVHTVDAPELFRRMGLYGGSSETEFADNTKRFSLFYRAALDACRSTSWIPDIIHAHDWHAAPAMAYRRFLFSSPQGGVLTIHNYEYQGLFPAHDIHYTGLEMSDFAPPTSRRRREPGANDTFSFLRCGILGADTVTAVSPSYAEEIAGRRPGRGENLFALREEPPVGILNGIDYEVWNPESDPFIPQNYSRDDPRGKHRCKELLQKELGLPVDAEIPLVGIISRLVPQKGIDSLLLPGTGCLRRMCEHLPVQFAVLGTGEAWAEEELRRLDRGFAHFSATIGFDEKLAHRIEAGSDFFLMPSKYEPCGLNQMYSLAYGTLPIVTATGGLIDTVEQYLPETREGTGFFTGQSPRDIYKTVVRALDVWSNRRDQIDLMRRTAMSRRFSWARAAGLYEETYASAVG